MNAGAEESLSVLAKYSQNLPSLARSLSRTAVKPELKTEVKHVSQLDRVNELPDLQLLIRLISPVMTL